MRKILSIILSFLYLFTSSGVLVHHHYCMGESAGISLFGINPSHCPACGMEKGKESKDCCKDVQVLIKTGNPHQSPSVALDCSSHQFILLPPRCFILQDGSFPSHGQSDEIVINLSPGRSRPIYIEVGNFRI